MSGEAEVYVLDEPTTRLHMQDVDNLIPPPGPIEWGRADGDRDRAQPRRRRTGRLGNRPRSGAGRDGGQVIFEGPATELIRAKGSLTGDHLRRQVAPGAAVGVG